MQIDELLSLTYWIDREIKERQVLQKYQKLQAAMQQNVNARNNQPRQPFNTQKEDVISTIMSVSTIGLTNAQENMLEKFGVLKFIGESGVDSLERLLYKNSLDIASATSEVSKIVQSLTSGIQRSDQLKSNIEPLLEEFNAEDELESKEVLMRVHFQNDVALNNLSDFKLWAKNWWEIGRGISMAHNKAPEDIKIVGAQKGSIIIELAVAAGIATTTSTIILSVLKVAERVLTIKKKLEEIKTLKLGNKKLEQELSKEADKAKSEGLESITNEISIKLEINPNGEGDRLKALEKSVKHLIDFVENGGEVDFFTDEDEDDNDKDIEELKVNFEEIKKIERKVLGLEKKKKP